MVFRAFFLKLSESRTAKKMILGFPLTRRVARRFIAGETLEPALDAIQELNARGIWASLDNLGENVETEEEAIRAKDTYINILKAIHERSLQSNISVKLTQLGLDIGFDFCRSLLSEIVDAARQYKNMIEVDMEGSAYTQKTIDIVTSIHEEYPNVGIAIQAYLKRSEQDIRMLVEKNIKTRLVKGAYKEPPDIAYQKKRDVNANFDRLVEILLDSRQYHAIGTHDTKRIEHVLSYITSKNIPRETFEFQFLYGIRRDLQTNLKNEGYNVRVYIPFGPQWYPYFMRRLAERPANVFFLVRNLFRA